MTSLIRDVLFPSAAALGLLAAAITDSALADESFYDEPVTVVAAARVPATAGPRPVTATAPAARASTPVEARPEGNRASAIEPRCERTGRIGKFKITRCD
jgi:hypothetical protein